MIVLSSSSIRLNVSLQMTGLAAYVVAVDERLQRLVGHWSNESDAAKLHQAAISSMASRLTEGPQPPSTALFA